MVAAALTVTLGAVFSESAAARPSAAVPALTGEKVASREDVVSARVTARAQGSRVEVESLRDGSSTTWVNPDGTMTTQQHGGPIRFKDPADPRGAWRDVDLSLAETADGTVAPKGHPLGLSLAGATRAAGGVAKGAGDTGVVVAGHGKGKGKQQRDVTLAWGGTLGKPTLSGTSATYRGVKPGVDLVVDARRTGYEAHLVINTQAALEGLRAAAKDGLVSWDIPVQMHGLTARSEKGGSVSFVDADGQVVSVMAAPVAWDDEVDAQSGNRVSESPVTMSVTQQGRGRAVLTLTPEQNWLFDPERAFPVTIDPTYAAASLTPSFDTYVSSAFPTATYSSSTELRVGTYNAGGDKYRSFLNFPIASAHGRDIVSASLSLYEFHSYSCTAKPFYVWSVPPTASSGTSWDNQPGAVTQFGSLSVAKGFSSSCAEGRVTVPVTSLVQAYADSSSSTASIRLHASETDTAGWKKFYSLESSQDPYITYTYNRKPNTASAPTLGAPAASYLDPRDGKTAVFTSASKPILSTRATDPDGNGYTSTIEVHSSTAGTSSSLVTYCTTPRSTSPYTWTASGGTASCTLGTALANNKAYYVRAAVADDQALWNDTWSPWTMFYTAFNNPPAPTVSCPGYTNGSWTDTAPAADVTCTIKATGVTGDYATPGYLDLVVDGVARPRLKITPTNDPAVVATTVTIPKTAQGAHSIVATAVARTLRTTSTTTSFGWGGASLSLPTVGTASSGRVAVAAGSPPRGGSASVTGKVQWRVAGSGNETTGWTDGPAVPVTNAAGGTPSVTDPVKVDTSFALSTAVREAGASADLNSRVPVLLDVQVCFTYAGVATPQCTWSQSPRSVTRVPHAFGGGYPTAQAGPGQVALFTGEFNTSATDVSVPGYSGDLALSRSHTSFDGDGTVTGWPNDPTTGVFGPGWTASLEGPEAGAAGLRVVDNTRTDGTIVLVDDEGEPLVYQTPTQDRAYKVTVTGASKSPYLPATTDTTQAAADLTITNTTAAPGATMQLRLTEEDGTVTTWAPVAYSATADTDWVPVSVNEPGQVGSTTYGRDATGRVTRIVAAVPPNGPDPATATAAVTCPTQGALVKGCRALDVTYATATTATAATPGDYTGRVKQVTATLWDPAASGGSGAMATTTVATYKYDTSGRLVSVSDPRASLGTDYTWDGTSTRLASVKATGLAAHRLSYDTTPGTPRVATVTRDNPAGSGTAVTLARYNYAVPLSGAGAELPDLTSESSSDQVRLWKQASVPVTGCAVFGPDYTGPISGTGVDWTRADLQYADAQGYTVNTASLGAGAWQVTATDYDGKGNVVRQLDAGATQAVRDAAAAGPEAQLDDGQVDALSTQTVYNTDIKDSTGAVVTPAGTLVTDTYGPSRNAALANDEGNDGVLDVRPVRPHTHTDYDQGAPNVVNGVGTNPANGEPWRLPTTITTGVAASDASPGEPDIETTTTTTNSYAKLSSADTTEGDPWVLGTPTKVTSGGITRTTRSDTEGRATQTRQPLSTGSDAGTTTTIYYTAHANTADAACGGKVEWAGLVCRTLPAANPTAGAGGAGTLPDSRTTAYNAWLQPLTVTETSGAVTRTTQTRYDPAGRTTATWTTLAGMTGSTARPGTFTHYIPAGQTAAGSVDYTGNLNSAKTDADPTARTSSTYDAWGRTLTSTNDLGDLTATTYVAPGSFGAGQVATITDPKGTTSYTYDGTDANTRTERRGLVTAQTITRPGTGGALTFKAAYDADGNMVTQTLPGQVTQTTGYDEAGEPQSLTYSGTVQPVTMKLDANGDPEADPDGNPVYQPDGPAVANQAWLAWSVVNDTQGRVRSESSGPSAGFDGNPGVADPADITGYDTGHAIGYDRTYSYDTAGRLTQVADHTAPEHGADLTASPCTVRTYGFDANGRRTTLSTATHPDGLCTGTTGVTTTSTSSNYYDTADRPTLGQGGTGQYVYDALGRQTTLPAADAPNPAGGNITLGYFDDDLPRSVTQAGTTTTFTLDSAGRRSTATTTSTAGTSSLVRHYTDGTDNPAWTIATDTLGQQTTTRYGESIGGDLGTTIAPDGSADLTLANMHGDIVTTVPIAATATSSTAASGTDGWSDYTEYGTPRDGSTTAITNGSVGYGWLGAKQRATTSETAGLTLMGDRLFDANTGRFTSLDPEPGGNDTVYAYPNDPINKYDLNGHKWRWRNAPARGLRAHACLMSLAACGLRRGNWTAQVCTWSCVNVGASLYGGRAAIGWGSGAASTKGRAFRGIGGSVGWSRGSLSSVSLGGSACLRVCYGRSWSGGKWSSSYGFGTRGGYLGVTSMQIHRFSPKRKGVGWMNRVNRALW